MPQTPADAASLTVLAGPMKGQRLVLDDAVDDILIGSDPDCRLCLDLPSVSPIHARLWLDPQGATLYDTHSTGGVYVNDDRVSEQAPLRDGDIVWLGAPAEPGSVMLRFLHPGASEPAPAAYDAPLASLGAETVEAPELADQLEPARQPAEPAAGGSAEGPDEWLIEDVTEPQPPLAAEAADPLESVLDDAALDWPDAQPEPPRSPSAPPEPPAPSAAVPDDDFYVIEEPEPAAPEAPASETSPAPSPDEDLFDWGAPQDEEAPAAAPADVSATEARFDAGAGDDALLIDWSEPAQPIPPAAEPIPPPPAPMATAPPEDEDVFYVESAEPLPPPTEYEPPAPEPTAPEYSAPAPRVRSEPPAPPAEPPAVRTRTSPSPAAGTRSSAPAVVGGIHVPRPRPAPSHEAPARAVAPRPSRLALGGKRVLLMAGGAVLALIVGALIATKLLGAPRVESIQPTRVRGGDTIVIQGRNFSTDEAAVVVRFEDQREGRILRATADRLEVEVPSIPTPPGRVNRVLVVVSVGGRESKPIEISVFQAPRIHGIAPNVAQPGDEVTLAGADWGIGATVRFGTLEAQILEMSPTSVRVRVPAVEAPEGTRLPVVVAMGGDSSNEVPFHLGRLPLMISVEPRTVHAGDSLVIRGMGFVPRPSAIDLRVGGTRAVVVKSSDTEILALVPRTPADGQNALELRVPGADHVGQGTLTIVPPVDPIDFRFIVEHLSAVGISDPENGHDHVVLSTGLGPAFLISAADGVSAAERAAEAQRRFGDVAATLKAALTADLEVRGLDGLPSIGLVGKQEPLLVVTGEDATAYDEVWTSGRGPAEVVTPARLAIWWGAVARDLVLLLVRGDRPRHAAALAPEGRALGALYDAAGRTGRFGVPRDAFMSTPAPLRQSVRSLAFRVPAAVKAPAEVSAAAAPVQALSLDGMWTGSETEDGGRRYMTVTFAGGTGTFTYERALSLTIPLQSVQQTGRREVQFDFRSGMHLRRYEGVWDGQRLRGRIVAEDGAEIGRFELERKR